MKSEYQDHWIRDMANKRQKHEVSQSAERSIELRKANAIRKEFENGLEKEKLTKQASQAAFR